MLPVIDVVYAVLGLAVGDETGPSIRGTSSPVVQQLIEMGNPMMSEMAGRLDWIVRADSARVEPPTAGVPDYKRLH
jgi:hypothetical protein